jgi:uncharacterized protein YutE (UPF0331/DUF86 family)
VIADEVSGLARIVGFRNVLVHGYATVDNRLVWGVIEANLAELIEVLSTLLKDA